MIAFWAGLTLGVMLGMVVSGLLSAARHADLVEENARLHRFARSLMDKRRLN